MASNDAPARPAGSRRLTSSLVLASAALALISAALPAYARDNDHVVRVSGEVISPATYTRSQLGALPQTTLTVNQAGRQVTLTGVLLETLVTTAGPAYPSTLSNTKNEILRLTATVRGDAPGPVTFAMGELDPNFGNHPALLVLSRDGRAGDDGTDLVVPGDRVPLRTVRDVSEISVGIATAPATNTSPAAGSPLVVHHDRRSVSLSSRLLSHLPSETLTVQFAGAGGLQTHTEVGPNLFEVLFLGGIFPTLNTWVAAVGSDNYVATVTPAEQLVGGRQLQVSLVQDGVQLAQPRLVTDGDVKGGRYVSGLVDLYAGTGPAH